jgi:4-amino-4-deoxy-L-arabinose transferase-like glycosyltransferase
MLDLFRKWRKSGNDKSVRRKHRRKRDRRTSSLEQFVVEEIVIGGVPDPVVERKLQIAPRSATSIKVIANWIGLWLILVLASLWIRDPWPVDETRLLAAAWEMWLRGSVIVPWLNGEYYVHPPLTYWVVHFGWWLFGVNDWWPRLMPSVFALASLYVTGRLARRLWPEAIDVQRYAPLVLLGTIFFALYLTMALPDMAAVFFTLVALWGIAIMWRSRDSRAWLLVGVALGFGLLAAGPMIFIYTLPPALMAPLWAKDGPKLNWNYWYSDIFKGVLFSLALFAGWAVPVANQAGVAYLREFIAHAQEFFVLDVFAASHPWWWYLLLMPVVSLPWSILPLVWLRLWHIRSEQSNAGMNFCIAWIVPALALLSLFDMKQPQFLLPLLPAGALMTVHLLLDDEIRSHGDDSAFSGMTIPMILFGSAAAILPKLPRIEYLPGMLWELSPFVGITMIVIGIALGWLPLKEIRRRTTDTAFIGIALTMLIVAGIGFQLNASLRVNDTALFIRQAQDANRPIAILGGYQGEYQFPGRLYRPLEPIAAPDADRWARGNSNGLIVVLANSWQPRTAGQVKPVFEGRSGEQMLRIWDAAAVDARRP